MTAISHHFYPRHAALQCCSIAVLQHCSRDLCSSAVLCSPVLSTVSTVVMKAAPAPAFRGIIPSTGTFSYQAGGRKWIDNKSRASILILDICINQRMHISISEFFFFSYCQVDIIDIFNNGKVVFLIISYNSANISHVKKMSLCCHIYNVFQLSTDDNF